MHHSAGLFGGRQGRLLIAMPAAHACHFNLHPLSSHEIASVEGTNDVQRPLTFNEHMLIIVYVEAKEG